MTMHTSRYQPTDYAPAQAPRTGQTGLPLVVRVGSDAAGQWLRTGLAVVRAAPALSLLYGALFALACAAMLALTQTFPWFTLAFLTGLLLIGPFLAAGLYGAARDHEAGRTVSIRATLGLLWERRTNLSLFAVFLALVMAAWVRFSALLFAVMDSSLSPTANSYQALLTGSIDPVLGGFFVLIGGLLALVVFVSSAIAMPMIVDRDAGPITAISTSVRAVTANWRAMAVWAAAIVGLTLIGILTAFVAMVVIFPVLGYATWASYRGLTGTGTAAAAAV